MKLSDISARILHFLSLTPVCLRHQLNEAAATVAENPMASDAAGVSECDDSVEGEGGADTGVADELPSFSEYQQIRTREEIPPKSFERLLEELRGRGELVKKKCDFLPEHVPTPAPFLCWYGGRLMAWKGTPFDELRKRRNGSCVTRNVYFLPSQEKVVTLLLDEHARKCLENNQARSAIPSPLVTALRASEFCAMYMSGAPAYQFEFSVGNFHCENGAHVFVENAKPDPFSEFCEGWWWGDLSTRGLAVKVLANHNASDWDWADSISSMAKATLHFSNPVWARSICRQMSRLNRCGKATRDEIMRNVLEKIGDPPKEGEVRLFF